MHTSAHGLNFAALRANPTALENPNLFAHKSPAILPSVGTAPIPLSFRAPVYGQEAVGHFAKGLSPGLASPLRTPRFSRNPDGFDKGAKTPNQIRQVDKNPLSPHL